MKSVKPSNNTYVDSTGIIHKREPLSDILNNLHNQKILWSGVAYMKEDQYANLSEGVSQQHHGIVLVWSNYNDTTSKPVDSNFNLFFIPKEYVKQKGGCGVGCFMGVTWDVIGSKYVYVSETRISGNEKNDENGTSNGITYNNKKFVLRYVIGV